jgi:hypothetical protein
LLEPTTYVYEQLRGRTTSSGGVVVRTDRESEQARAGRHSQTHGDGRRSGKEILALDIAFLVPAIANAFLLQLARDYSETARKRGKQIYKGVFGGGAFPCPVCGERLRVSESPSL